MINYRAILLAVGIVSATASLSHSQVAIGKGEPAKAALLQLKTSEPANPASDNVTSTTGGLLLPRVKLVNINTLEPFVAANDNDWINNATTKIKETHAGLMVYNLSNSAPFVQGLYTWDGNMWLKGASGGVKTANNGLSMAGSEAQLGGTLTGATTINLDRNNLTVEGSGDFKISSPLSISSLKYPTGAGANKVLTSDDEGNAEWATPGSFASTPAASFMNGTGIILNQSSGWTNTWTKISIPPGRWIVFVTILAEVRPPNGNGADNQYWVNSTFINTVNKQTEPQSADYEGNMYISGRVRAGYNIITGSVILKNTGTSNMTFDYFVGKVKQLSGGNEGVQLVAFAAKPETRGENSIVAFELK